MTQVLNTASPHLGNEENREPDRDIHQAVLTALESSRYRPLWKLRCEVREGVVFLLGMVPSFFLKQAAQELLLRLGPVKEVRNQVEVCRSSYAPAGGRQMVAAFCEGTD